MRLRLSLLALLYPIACGPAVDDPSASGSDDGTESAGTGSDPSASTSSTPPGSSSDTLDACQLEPDPGFCDAAFPYYYFDPQTQRCEVFIYGGCDGVVPFYEEDECISQCESCETYTDPAPSVAPPIEVTVRNTLEAPVWIMGYEATSDAAAFRQTPIKLTDVQGTILVTTPNACDASCSSYIANGCTWGCSDSGPPPGPILLQPGGEFRTSIPGSFLRPSVVPERCEAGLCPDVDTIECGTVRPLSEYADYELFVDYSTTVPCNDPAACECTANADGWCQLPATFDTADFPERASSYFYIGATAEITI